MMRLLIGELPVWVRRDHPVLRYELGKITRPPVALRLLRAFLVLAALALFTGVGYVIATNFLTRPAGETLFDSIHAIAYIPLLIGQLVLRVIAFAMTGDAVGEEIRRQQWDSLRATSSGADLALRARWIGVFHRQRPLITLILISRVLLIGVMLYELTAFQGRYLDLLIYGVTPEVPLAGAVLLLSFMMTAVLLLPLTGVAFDAAVGLLVSSLVQRRSFNTLVQFALILVRAALTFGLLMIVSAYLNGSRALPDPLAWLLALVFGGTGDWGLSYLLLTRFGQLWATIPYAIFIGLGLVGFALVQAWLADRIIALAVRRAQHG